MTTIIGSSSLLKLVVASPSFPALKQTIVSCGAMAEEAPPPKRRRYSREPDLDVEVDGEVFHVGAHVLMMTSDVFARMLETEMREVNEGRVVLPGTHKDEFRALLQRARVMLNLHSGRHAALVR